MPDQFSPADISDQPRAFTVDDVLANDVGTLANRTTPEPEADPEPEATAAEVIAAAFQVVVDTHALCAAEIDRLVAARLDINAQIKERRRQLNMLERAHRIVEEPAPDEDSEEPTLDLDDYPVEPDTENDVVTYDYPEDS